MMPSSTRLLFALTTLAVFASSACERPSSAPIAPAQAVPAQGPGPSPARTPDPAATEPSPQPPPKDAPGNQGPDAPASAAAAAPVAHDKPATATADKPGPTATADAPAPAAPAKPGALEAPPGATLERPGTPAQAKTRGKVRQIAPLEGSTGCVEMFGSCTPPPERLCTSSAFYLDCGERGTLPSTGEMLHCVCK
jgi:hypothetical protein